MFTQPCIHDEHYPYCPHEHYPYHHPAHNCIPPHMPYTDYPSAGPMVENEFLLVNGNPYIVDNTEVSYAQRINVAESVFTRFTQRKDDACINIASTIDLTKSNTTNTVLNHFIEQIILNKYDDLNGVLPILKSTLKIKMTFTVSDIMGAVVYTNTVSVPISEIKYHATDMKDYFLSSATSMLITEIPALEFQGLYMLSITRFEAWADVINTNGHIVDNLNPYYQFTENNTKVVLQHDTINPFESDDSIMICGADILYQTQFQANITTRFKLSFNVFMSDFISTINTFNIWNNLNDTTVPELKALQETVATMQTDITDIDTRVTTLENIKPTMLKYDKNVEYTTGQIVWLTVGQLFQVVATFTSDNTETNTVEQSLLADISGGKLVAVKTDTE